jgi:transcriptional regulator with XRE-family HTH domain
MELMDLRTRRQALGLTLDQLSNATGVSYSQLARLERCGAPVTERVAGLLASVLGTTAEEILAGQQMLAIRAREALLAGTTGSTGTSSSPR